MSALDHFVGLMKAPRSDVMVLLSTFTLTVLVDLTVAVQVGVVMASLLFIRRMAEVSNVGMITRELEAASPESDPLSLTRRVVPEGVEVFEIQGAFFFGAANRFKEAIDTMERPPEVMILRMRSVFAMDATGLFALEEFLHRCRRHGTHLVLSGVHTQPLMALRKKGLWDEIGEENIFADIDSALARARELIGAEGAAGEAASGSPQ
jgi:SulP family sulfate permease